MSTFYTGGPAFPQDYEHVKVLAELAPGMTDKQILKATKQLAGMTLRQYAAIHLKVPNSGDEWLDEMIAASVRNDLAAKAMQSFLLADGTTHFAHRARESYEMADEMVKAQKGSTP
jgi:hypothetical protein